MNFSGFQPYKKQCVVGAPLPISDAWEVKNFYELFHKKQRIEKERIQMCVSEQY